MMDRDTLHACLVHTLGLVPDPVANPVARSYFHQRVDWHPQRSTRVFRLVLDAQGAPQALQLCASSDNNNTVLAHPPFSEVRLQALADQEITRLQARQGAGAPGPA